MVRLGRLLTKNRATIKKLSIRGNKTRHLHHWYNRQFPMSVFERKCKTPCHSYGRRNGLSATSASMSNMFKTFEYDQICGLFCWLLVTCYACYATISHYVGPSIGQLVGHWPMVSQLVPRLLFRHFVSSFCITAPAQSQATDAVVYTLYTAPTAAHAPHITAPAQARATDTVMYKALLRIGPEKSAKSPLEGWTKVPHK